jgi:hypothetical protein
MQFIYKYQNKIVHLVSNQKPLTQMTQQFVATTQAPLFYPPKPYAVFKDLSAALCPTLDSVIPSSPKGVRRM